MVAFYTGILYHILSLTIKFQILKMIKGRTFENNTISDRVCQLNKIKTLIYYSKKMAFCINIGTSTVVVVILVNPAV